MRLVGQVADVVTCRPNRRLGLSSNFADRRKSATAALTRETGDMSGMTTSIFGSGLHIKLAVKPKIFASYHHGGDQAYYDTFSRTFHNTYDVITDNSLERQIDSDDVDYVMRRIRENYITGSSCTIVLVGPNTWGRKYVDWEIKATLDKEHSLVGVQLPTLHAGQNGSVIVPDRLYDNIQSGYAIWTTWATITASAQACANYVKHANDRDKRLIVNSRDRRLRNA